MAGNETQSDLFRVLALDGGGAKGFYTLGVLHEIEAMVGPLHERFNLVYGTSTGAIIAALICLGHSVADIRKLYQEHVLKVMARILPGAKSQALADLAREVFGNAAFTDVKTGIGIVCTKWNQERPMIFKASKSQAFGSKSSFVPGFGVPIGEAVQASCSAYPFFKKKTVVTSLGESIDLGDGGFCANNPSLYALADSVVSMKTPRENVRLVSVGVGEYPSPKAGLLSLRRWINYMFTVRFLQKTLEINTQSMDQLRIVLFKDVKTVRISQAYTQPEMATDMFEHNAKKLDELWQRGRRSFEGHEAALKEFLL